MATAEALARQQESLQAIVESISSELHLRPLLTRIVRHACELIGADNGTIGLVDPVRAVVRTEAIWQMPESELGAEMPRGVGLAGAVLAEGRPIVLQRYGEIALPTQPALAANAVIGIPIWWREQMIGFFGIGTDATRRTRAFTEEDVQSLTLFARHAAVAIENARLYTATQQSLAELQLLYETSIRIGAALTLRDVVVAYLQQVAAGGRYGSRATMGTWCGCWGAGPRRWGSIWHPSPFRMSAILWIFASTKARRSRWRMSIPILSPRSRSAGSKESRGARRWP